MESLSWVKPWSSQYRFRNLSYELSYMPVEAEAAAWDLQESTAGAQRQCCPSGHSLFVRVLSCKFCTAEGILDLKFESSADDGRGPQVSDYSTWIKDATIALRHSRAYFSAKQRQK